MSKKEKVWKTFRQAKKEQEILATLLVIVIFALIIGIIILKPDF